MNIRNIILLISIIIVAGVSCEQQVWTLGVDCDECYIDKPEKAFLDIYLTHNEENDSVLIEIYKGNFEDDDLVEFFYSYADRTYSEVDINKFYSIKAYYKKGEQTIIATDGTKVKRALVSDLCTDAGNNVTVDCWIIKDEVLNVRIKE